ncbi:MAG: thioredoxin family protein [Cyclobacteriaceae bacterium]|nr:thioredoxin family protein [Cyclobacteriaceae bacterium]
MALTSSNMLPLGTIAPDFTLFDTVSEKKLSLNELKSDKATLIMFICNHCPYVKHMKEELVRIANDYMQDDVLVIAISSNDAEYYPEDAPDLMRKDAKKFEYPFPYLYDETQEIARAYQAACTPDFYLFDKNMKLVYRGQLDDSRPGNEIPLTGKDLRDAIEDLLKGNPIAENQVPSVGCNIKWK